MSEHEIVDAFFPDDSGGDVGDFDYVDDDAVPAPRDEHQLADEMVDRADTEALDTYAAERFLDVEDHDDDDPELYADDGQQIEDWMPPAPEGTDPAEWAFASQVARDTLTAHLTGEALQQQPVTRASAEQQLGDMLSASTAASLSQLAEAERYRAEREQVLAARSEKQQTEQQAVAYGQAHEIALQAMARSDVKNANPDEIIEGANIVLSQWGYADAEAFNALSEWQRQEIATAAIGEAAEMQRTITITNDALRKV
jgi:hypothetical protein